jgi:tRNA(Ile)-lysidine synthase TilS/MesJ
LLTDDIPGVIIGYEQCNFCDLHDSLEKKYSNAKEYESIMKTIRRKGRNKPYDCLIGISGGVDSSWLVYEAIAKWELNPLVIHFDNGWNTDAAEINMEIMRKNLGFDFIRFRYDIDELNKSFLNASVSDADIPNDIAMLTLFMETAERYKIKYIFNGHDFRTEGSCPLGWSYMDGKYLEDIAGEKRSYPNLTLRKQIIWGLKRFVQIRPLYYTKRSKDERKEMLMNFGWLDYGGTHCENKYTAFIGSYLLPEKFGIDKRVLYLSAQIRSGYIDKDTAKKKLSEPIEFDENIIDEIKNRLYLTDEEFDNIMKTERNTFKDFETYHDTFIRYKPLFWLAGKFRLFPETFVKKYTQEISFE